LNILAFEQSDQKSLEQSKVVCRSESEYMIINTLWNWMRPIVFEGRTLSVYEDLRQVAFYDVGVQITVSE